MKRFKLVENGIAEYLNRKEVVKLYQDITKTDDTLEQYSDFNLVEIFRGALKIDLDLYAE